MYVKHYKGIVFTISMVVCILFMSKYTSNLDNWTRASVIKQPLFAKDVRELTGKKIDLDGFLQKKKNNLDVKELQRERKNKLNAEKLTREKKNKLNAQELTREKENNLNAQDLQREKKNNSNAKEIQQEKKNKQNIQEIRREKKNKSDVQELQQRKNMNFDAKELQRETNSQLDGKEPRRDKKNGERKKVELLPGKKDKLNIEENLSRRKGFDDEKSPVMADAESIRRKLNQTIVNVEEDVFIMNVKHILKSMPVVPFDANRLVHNIQRAQRDPKYKCVIRIGKYCAQRCHHYITNGLEGAETFYLSHSVWKMFPCDFAQPCKVETRFVGNLTSEIMDSSDVIFFMSALHEGLQLMRLIASRPPGQIWTLYSRESPYHDPEYAPPGLTGNPFNLSITYARDTDIHFPYCTITKKQVRPPPLPKKTKLIAWMASNCHRLSWRRGDLVKELQKHLAVDAYGECGSLGRLNNPEQVLPSYKFYLAFENSECRDYITEKLWRTCLLQGIVPIVYGAKREDYEQTLPKNSFIYIEDFSNMSAFVDFIHELDSDDARYEKYFDWRTESHVTFLQDRKFALLFPESNMWYLLKKLIHLYIHPETSWQKKTPNFASWWQGQCPDLNIEKKVLGLNVHLKKSQTNSNSLKNNV